MVNATRRSPCFRMTALQVDYQIRHRDEPCHQVGPLLQHKDVVVCAAISVDGGCDNANAYVWDINTILKNAGFEGLLSILEASPQSTYSISLTISALTCQCQVILEQKTCDVSWLFRITTGNSLANVYHRQTLDQCCVTSSSTRERPSTAAGLFR
jgi:hypothetical protein